METPHAYVLFGFPFFAGDLPAPKYNLSLDAAAVDRWAPLVDGTLDLDRPNLLFLREIIPEQIIKRFGGNFDFVWKCCWVLWGLSVASGRFSWPPSS